VGRIPPPQGRLPTPCGQGVLIGGYCHKAFLGGGEKGKVAVFGEEEREKGEFWSSWTSSYVAASKVSNLVGAVPLASRRA
jgi:hypothetical protein